MARGTSRQFSTSKISSRLTATLLIGGCLGVVLAIGTSSTNAQGGAEFNVGKNVDIVGPHGTSPYDPGGSNPFFLGDPDKKQQNEPSCDVSPNNPLVVFCGMNSYSAVDRPDISGEPWVGASFTMDGGLTWKSHLHPGFKPSAGPAPLAPPIGYETAADPVVRLAPGIGLYTFIAFNRAGTGALLLGRWYEKNIEGGFPYAWKDTIEIAKAPADLVRPDVPRQAGNHDISASGRRHLQLPVPDPIPARAGKTRIQRCRPASSMWAMRCSPAAASRTAPRPPTPDRPTTGRAATRPPR